MQKGSAQGAQGVRGYWSRWLAPVECEKEEKEEESRPNRLNPGGSRKSSSLELRGLAWNRRFHFDRRFWSHWKHFGPLSFQFNPPGSRFNRSNSKW